MRYRLKKYQFVCNSEFEKNRIALFLQFSKQGEVFFPIGAEIFLTGERQERPRDDMQKVQHTSFIEKIERIGPKEFLAITQNNEYVFSTRPTFSGTPAELCQKLGGDSYATLF